MNQETDVWETKGQTYDTGSDIKDSYFAAVDSVNNLLKTAGNEVMAITALPESSWAAAKGWAQDRNVSLREATGDFDSTIGAIPIVSAVRPSNIPRMLRQVFGKPARQAARLAGEGRGGLKAAGEVSDLPPVPELRKTDSSLTIEGAKLETAQVPTSTQVGLKGNVGGVTNARMGPNEGPQISSDLLLARQQLEISNGVNLQTFDFGAHLRSVAGDPPAGMLDPHAHHILFKKGLGQKQQDLVVEGQNLLRKYEIDPILGYENLIWAPNRIKGQHDINALQQVIDTIKMTDEMFGTRDEMVNALKLLGKTAAERR